MGYKTVGRFVYDSATAQIVAEGGNVVFDNATISNNCALSSPGAGIVRIKKPGLYNVFFNATTLHDMVVNAIAQAKQAGKEPPEGMERVWDWEHERIIEDTAEVRNLLGMLNA